MTDLGVWIPIAALIGLVVGSFSTIVAERVPHGESVLTPPSRCDDCGVRLAPVDLVPVVSWLTLRGRCRHCHADIGIEPIAVELATAGIFVLFTLEFGDDPVLLPFWVLGATLVVQTSIDLKTQRLPREITYSAIIVGGIGLVIAALVDDEPERIWMSALGAVIALALLGGIHAVSRGGMGFGDVILAPLLGMFLGWLNPGIVVPGLFFGFLAGAATGVAVMAADRAGRRTVLPFGPFLALGTVVAVFVGQPFVDLVMAR